MKLLKLTMLAATAAVAASAFIGASSASAAHPVLALCDAPQLLLCEASHLIAHPLEGRYLLLIGAGAFSAGFVTIKCTGGHGESNTRPSQETGGLKATLEKLTFNECTGCTNVAVKTPQAAEVSMESEGTETWRLKSTGAKVTFSGCPFGTTCEYEGNLNLKVQMDEEGAFADPENTKFKKVGGGGLCSAEGTWESGRSRVDWKLDNAEGTIHKNITPTLQETLLTIDPKVLP
jgi:hypothetical protein